MATKNANYYSCRAGRPDTIKSHRVITAAMNAAKEFGQVWDTKRETQMQIHASTSGGWMTVKPDKYFSVDLKSELIKYGLIEE